MCFSRVYKKPRGRFDKGSINKSPLLHPRCCFFAAMNSAVPNDMLFPGPCHTLSQIDKAKKSLLGLRIGDSWKNVATAYDARTGSNVLKETLALAENDFLEKMFFCLSARSNTMEQLGECLYVIGMEKLIAADTGFTEAMVPAKFVLPETSVNAKPSADLMSLHPMLFQFVFRQHTAIQRLLVNVATELNEMVFTLNAKGQVVQDIFMDYDDGKTVTLATTLLSAHYSLGAPSWRLVTLLDGKSTIFSTTDIGCHVDKALDACEAK
jgi:hypothetical protein